MMLFITNFPGAPVFIFVKLVTSPKLSSMGTPLLLQASIAL